MDSEDRQRYDASEDAFAGTDDILKDLYGSYYSGTINAKQLKSALKMHRNGSGEDAIRKFLANAMNGK